MEVFVDLRFNLGLRNKVDFNYKLGYAFTIYRMILPCAHDRNGGLIVQRRDGAEMRGTAALRPPHERRRGNAGQFVALDQ